jgi:meso-butanediol dehydrogenase / (S,S)-butanediol dehydrogenase / diacetyl reductase
LKGYSFINMSLGWMLSRLKVNLPTRRYIIMTRQIQRFENKVALVTGGRSGIGRAVARRLSDEGATVITAQRGEDKEFDGITADFSDPNTAERVVAEVIAREGRVDVLILMRG